MCEKAHKYQQDQRYLAYGMLICTKKSGYLEFRHCLYKKVEQELYNKTKNGQT